MAPPLTLDGQHVWVGDGAVYTLPEYRIAGLYAPANGEISTPPFVLHVVSSYFLCLPCLLAGAVRGTAPFQI